jgi:hypothetical protein
MYSSSSCGAASSTRSCICGPMTASARRGTQSVIWTFTMAGDHIRGLDGSTRDQACFTALPLRSVAYNPGRAPFIDAEIL